MLSGTTWCELQLCLSWLLHFGKANQFEPQVIYICETAMKLFMLSAGMTYVCKWNSDTGQMINEYYSSAPQLLLFLENTGSSSFDFHFYVFPSTISSPAPILTLVLPNALHRIGAQERVVLRERDDFEVWGKILIVLS